MRQNDLAASNTLSDALVICQYGEPLIRLGFPIDFSRRWVGQEEEEKITEYTQIQNGPLLTRRYPGHLAYKQISAPTWGHAKASTKFQSGH